MSQQNKKQKNKDNARDNVTVAFLPHGWEDYQHWSEHDIEKHQQIDLLIKTILRTPFEGIGRPEPLKGDLTGYWSRRIDREHRMVYFYEDGTLTIISCRYHYD
ncbi:MULTISPECIES: Txe/YoeB family addiction module toxin [Pseudomonas]|uniref:Txe/YoeB family addiction module toxin n=1 Tax=Pseudomonas TaxID=286 RepID=UPI0009EA61D4|nr:MULTISPECIES: Txe/YoeB family addiction module toxin [Pseudomonas]MDG9809425.1 Txe/YoeB family addiction module toxin [Pseudomonas juntendi]MDG9815781.1 Txe/YoeB family addiction module toxin [Pseudomonas putida]